MAQATLAVTKLSLKFEVGLNEKGESIFKTKTLSNVKTAATTDQLFQTANAIGVLCSNPLNAVSRNDSYDIIA